MVTLRTLPLDGSCRCPQVFGFCCWCWCLLATAGVVYGGVVLRIRNMDYDPVKAQEAEKVGHRAGVHRCLCLYVWVP